MPTRLRMEMSAPVNSDWIHSRRKLKKITKKKTRTIRAMTISTTTQGLPASQLPRLGTCCCCANRAEFITDSRRESANRLRRLPGVLGECGGVQVAEVRRLIYDPDDD